MTDVYAEISELKRRIESMVLFGTVVESRSAHGRAMVRVAVYERVTDWLPVASMCNDFVSIWLPPKVGMQVTVISPGGDAAYGVVIPAIFNTQCKEPDGAGEGKAIVTIGGTRVESDGGTVRVSAQKVVLDAPVTETTGDLAVAGSVTDARGDLTGHSHETTDGATAKAR